MSGAGPNHVDGGGGGGGGGEGGRRGRGTGDGGRSDSEGKMGRHRYQAISRCRGYALLPPRVNMTIVSTRTRGVCHATCCPRLYRAHLCSHGASAETDRRPGCKVTESRGAYRLCTAAESRGTSPLYGSRITWCVYQQADCPLSCIAAPDTDAPDVR